MLPATLMLTTFCGYNFLHFLTITRNIVIITLSKQSSRVSHNYNIFLKTALQFV